ncbi:hypothetical protein [Methylovulum miyakonense]|uniref:hypothetical protein n=1 Tax=Methylovulum miyakonense TaxID=645578 RepID=UPI00035EC79D|nr:hypothetical protein [Methylovulum miyakonense]
MKQERHSLIATVFFIGVIIALLSYLFHPDVGVFKLVVNGQPVDNAIVQFAAIPSVLAVMLISGVLAALLFFGVGLVIFFAALFVALFAVFLFAPFFWPVLVIILLMAALMPFNSRR